MITELVLEGKKVKLVDLELTINRYVWKGYTQLTGLDPVSSLNIQNYYTNGKFSGGSLNSLFSVFTELIIESSMVNGTFKPELIHRVNLMVWDMNNAIYNLCYRELLKYITSLDILDLLEVQGHSKLKQAMERVRDELSVSSIEDSYKVLEDILANDKGLRKNPVSQAFIGGSVNPKQLRQVLAAIGYRVEIDSTIFGTPIGTSFTEGIRDMYSFSIESRSAARALFFSKDAIAKSETFAKHLQLLMMPITKLMYGDCGNRDVSKMFIRPLDHPSMVEGSKGDLYSLVGKLYKLEPTDAEFMVIKMNDKHLIGKDIYMRRANTCKLTNPHHVCSSCFGALSTNLPIQTNLGHYAANALMKPASQSILSIKHLISSATASDAIIDKVSRNIMHVAGPKFILDIDSIASFDKVTIKLKKDEAFVIKDIRNKSDLQKVNPERASNITNIYMELTKGDEVIKNTLEVGNVHRTGRLSAKFFEYILINGYTMDNKGNYIIDLGKWRLKSAFMVLPEVEFSYFTLFLSIAKMIKTRSILKGGTSRDTPDSLIYKLFDLINTKLSVNIAYIELIVYALSAKDLPNDDYSLARGTDNPALLPLADAITARGLGALTAYGLTSAKSINPLTLISKSKVSHPLDVLLFPNEHLRDTDDYSLGKHDGLINTILDT